MLLIPFIKENKEKVIKLLNVKNFKNTEILDNIISFDEARKSTQKKLDETLAKSKNIAKEIGGLFKSGRIEEANAKKAETGTLKELAKTLTEELAHLKNKTTDLLLKVPNIPHESVPAGNSENDNETIKTVGEIPKLYDGAKPHWELTDKYDIIDFELGNKITGAGFPVYKGQGARLQRALINFFLDEATSVGFREVQPPLMVNSDSGYGTGQLPDKDGQMYHVGVDDLYLIPTAEVPITNIYRDTIVDAKDFPIRNTAYSQCFRREAGSYGKDVRGLNRLHQFDKVEIVVIEHPDKSYARLEEMSDYVQSLLKKLELPYRVLRLCGGDTSFTAALTYDMEVYSAAQERWLEVSSVSNFESYQANRLKLRFKDENGKTKLAHTLNGSALALPRIVAALLENNQTPDGIRIPKALVPYTGFEYIK
ncbi:MAG: serine--tRNA ligase [Bacteroidetes bacterium]|nr:MAG: serine--tRNA ligase [Bacteroidota bacterium]